MKKFRVEDMNGNDVFGLPLPEDNVYISQYGALKHGKRPKELEVGESCVQTYSQSMQTPTDYRVIRIE